MDQAAALLELQRLDLEILRATKRLDELPEKQAILETRAKRREVGAMHEKAQLLVHKLQAEVKARQDETAMLVQKIDGEQAKIMATTDHRAVQSLTREMDGLKRRCDKLEMEMLQFMERIDKASTQVATVESAVQKLAQREEALIAKYREVGRGIQADIAQLQTERDSAAAAVSPDTLKQYEAIRESRGGVGVGELQGDTCTACRMSLPAQRVQTLQGGPDIAMCPQCRRLLVVRRGDSE